MKVSMSWFNEFTDISDITPKQYADAMTMSGTMVEGIENLGEGLVNVFTGRITEITAHENADSLVVCKLDMGSEMLQIVTGAKNVKEGQIVPVATHGAKLAGGINIKRGKLRGMESQGMLCSHEELGISTAELGYEPEDGILILDDAASVGIDIREVFGLNENVVEFEVTSNRPDCQSVIGLARETAATFGRGINLPVPDVSGNSESVADFAKVDVLDSVYCPRYCARMVKNVKIAPSPDWMVKRLKASGIRAINNIVDITNYVLLEYGQPMHAFDMRDLAGSHIIVRRAEDGEVITTLDDQQRKLDSDMLVIADEKRAVAVAGVMGAANSEVKSDTTAILFESANFDGASVRVTAKKLGLRTESSAKYEKGIDPHMTKAAVDRACQLVEMLGAGEVVGGMIDVSADLPKAKVLTLRCDKIRAFLGADIDDKFMTDTLEMLGFAVDSAAMSVTCPTYRSDVESEADLAEEIVRIYGYDKIPSTIMTGETVAAAKTSEQKMRDKIMDILTAQGMYEILTYSFTSPHIFDKLHVASDSPLRNVVQILNPLGEENSIMRTTTVASMLDIMAHNNNQRNTSASLFEIAKIYTPVDGQDLPAESDIITLGMYGDGDFYDIKGVLEAMMAGVGIGGCKFALVSDNPMYHPGRCASVSIGGEMIGYIGQIHPAVGEEYGIDCVCYVAEIGFGAVCKHANYSVSYKKLPKYPAVTRDVAIIADDSVLAGDIADIIKKSAGKLLEDIKLFDIYKGTQIEAGKKSMAYAIVLRANDKTLTDEEVTAVMNKILKNIEKQTGALLR